MTNEDWCDLHDLPRDQCAHCGASPGTAFEFLNWRLVVTGARGGDELVPSPATPTSAPRKADYGSSSAGTCACGQPTRDSAYGCDDCGNELRRVLADSPWWAEQLEITMTKQRGKRPGAGGASAARWYTKRVDGVEVEESAVPWHEKAAELGHRLRNHLVTTVRLCEEAHVRHSSPYNGLPEDIIDSISTWLLWRVDGLMFNPAFGEILREAVQIEKDAGWLVDRQPDRIFLGPCRFRQVCGGVVYSKSGDKVAKCRACGTEYDVAEARTDLEKQLDDRLCTAAEIAKLATYLGIQAERDVVRRRINRWHNAGVLKTTAWVTNIETGEQTPRFRFGDVLPRLAVTYQRKD